MKNQYIQRYYILFKKNDPKSGGTAYLQSKVYAAKECLMEKYPDAAEHEKKFYEEFVKHEVEREQNEKKLEEDKNTKKQEKQEQNK